MVEHRSPRPTVAIAARERPRAQRPALRPSTRPQHRRGAAVGQSGLTG